MKTQNSREVESGFKNQPSKTPWQFSGMNSREIFDRELCRTVCTVADRFDCDDSTEANANLIVEAVNQHAALVGVADAIKDLMPILNELHPDASGLGGFEDIENALAELNRIRTQP